MQENMELRLISPTEDGFIERIQWNGEEIKDAVATIVSEYTCIVYSEDTVKTAKEDRATLNKLKKAIEDRRKEVKKKCLEPYELFEREVKEVIALIDEPIAMIDSQIKGFEDEQKKAKREKLVEVYEENIGDLKEMFPFDRLFEASWLNATVTLKKASGELTDKIEKIANDLLALEKTVDEKYRTAVVAKYVQTLDGSAAMSEHYRLKELDEIAERRKAEAEQKKAETEKVAETPQIETVNTEVEVPPVIEKVQEPEPIQNAEPVKECRFYVKCTKTQLIGLAQYMKANGIEYGNIK